MFSKFPRDKEKGENHHISLKDKDVRPKLVTPWFALFCFFFKLHFLSSLSHWNLSSSPQTAAGIHILLCVSSLLAPQTLQPVRQSWRGHFHAAKSAVYIMLSVMSTVKTQHSVYTYFSCLLDTAVRRDGQHRNAIKRNVWSFFSK